MNTIKKISEDKSPAWQRKEGKNPEGDEGKTYLTSATTARDPDSRINKSLRKWNC